MSAAVTEAPLVPLELDAVIRAAGRSTDLPTVAQRWNQVVAALPEAPALTCRTTTLTFREVDLRARALGALVGGSGPVALLAEQDSLSLTAAIGLVLGGRTVVVLDPMLPADRWLDILQRAGVDTLIADRARRGAVPGVDEIGLEELVDRAAAPDLPRPGSTSEGSDLFWVFTSGSTGTPKGVRYGDRILLNEAVGGRCALDFAPGDQVALVLPVAFAAGLAVMWMALLNGAGLVIGDPRLHGAAETAHLLESRRITTLHTTPSLLRSLLAVLPPSGGLSGVRLVTTCGEAVHGRDIRQLREHLDPTAAYVSWSGSSETGHLAFHWIGPQDAVPDGIVPVGRVAANKTVRLLDADGRDVKAGDVGTIHLESAYLAAGYVAGNGTTADPFVAVGEGLSQFRMGDRARFDADGVLHLLGRGDAAVKIRGYLVEPAEVEAALADLPEVGEVVVRAEAETGGPARLVAWIEPTATTRTLSTTAVRRRLREKLPEWMVPSVIVLLPVLPRNERGKLDRAGLVVPGTRADGTAPATSWERVIADIWCEILDVEQVFRESDFMELGGDSLHVEEMLTRVGQRLRCVVTASDLAEAPALAEFATRVGRVGAAPRRSPTITVRGAGSRPPLFCFAGAGATAVTFLPLATAMGDDQPVHCFQPHGLDYRALPDWTVRRAAKRHVQEILRLQPEGPYHLVGHSLGGLVALEAAHLLSASGRRVTSLVLLDTYLPERVTRSLRAAASAQPSDLVPLPDETGDAAARPTLWQVRRLVPFAGLVRMSPDNHRLAMTEQGLRVARYHRPRPWAGPATLVVSAQNTDDTAWWGGILTGSVEVVPVASDHVSLVREPHIAGIADRIRRSMDAGTP